MTDATFLFLADEESAPALDTLEAMDLARVRRDAADLALDPVTVAVVTGAAILGARFIVSVWERWRGGVRIDMGTHPPTVERIRDLPYGMVVVLTVDNDVRIETFDEPREAVERILASILSMPTGASSDQVTAAAAEARAAA